MFHGFAVDYRGGSHTMRLPGGDDNFLHDNLIGSQQNMPGKITCNPDGVGISFITDKTDFQFIDSCLNGGE